MVSEFLRREGHASQPGAYPWPLQQRGALPRSFCSLSSIRIHAPTHSFLQHSFGALQVSGTGDKVEISHYPILSKLVSSGEITKQTSIYYYRGDRERCYLWGIIPMHGQGRPLGGRDFTVEAWGMRHTGGGQYVRTRVRVCELARADLLSQDRKGLMNMVPHCVCHSAACLFGPTYS